MSLKQKYGMSSDQAGDAKAGLYGAMMVIAPVVGTFGADWMKLVALVIFCLAQVGINYLHVGSGVNAADFDPVESPSDLLERGR